jgi:SAM-dependent methyltransferase
MPPADSTSGSAFSEFAVRLTSLQILLHGVTLRSYLETEHEEDVASMEMKEQAGALLAHAAGQIGARTIAIGLEHGLIANVAEHGPISPADLADITDVDPFYVEVWCRAAFAAGVLEGEDDEGRHRLAPHMETLLLDHRSPAYVGGLFTVMSQPDMFDGFSSNLPSGDQVWWDELSNDFVKGVAATGAAFNNRFIPGGISQVDGAEERLDAGGSLLEMACGTGYGLIRTADRFPNLQLVGLDGDAYSLGLAEERIEEAGLSDRIELIDSTMEDLGAENEFDAITINVSMHECRDIEAVTTAIHHALKPGGYFLNSDFSFPETEPELQTIPGRIMSGVQIFEAQIGDQLLPTSTYLELLNRHGFNDVGVVELTPIHAITYGSK